MNEYKITKYIKAKSFAEAIKLEIKAEVTSVTLYNEETSTEELSPCIGFTVHHEEEDDE